MFFPVTLEKLILSSRSLILMSTSGTASPALTGEAEAMDAKAWCAAEAVDPRIPAVKIERGGGGEETLLVWTKGGKRRREMRREGSPIVSGLWRGWSGAVVDSKGGC